MKKLTVTMRLYDIGLKLKGLSFKAVRGCPSLRSEICRGDSGEGYLLRKHDYQEMTEELLVKYLAELHSAIPYDAIKIVGTYHLTAEELFAKILLKKTSKIKDMKSENYPKESFMEYYNKEVKELALKCAEGYCLMYDVENGNKKPDCPEVDALSKSKKDLMAVWCVGLMVRDIERANNKGIRLDFINGVSQVHGALTSDSYWANVWGGDFSSEEAKNLRELGDKMKVLITKM